MLVGNGHRSPSGLGEHEDNGGHFYGSRDDQVPRSPNVTGDYHHRPTN